MSEAIALPCSLREGLGGGRQDASARSPFSSHPGNWEGLRALAYSAAAEAERLHRAVGQRLRSLREDQGLTQERLAARARVHRTFVGKVERGETATTVDTIAIMCSALGTSLADFFQPFSEPFEMRGPRRRTDFNGGVPHRASPSPTPRRP